MNPFDHHNAAVEMQDESIDSIITAIRLASTEARRQYTLLQIFFLPLTWVLSKVQFKKCNQWSDIADDLMDDYPFYTIERRKDHKMRALVDQLKYEVKYRMMPKTVIISDIDKVA